tara:strand:- start:1281 stop:1415 length:135 start_codon:yes stop_codon:yes gene_type:complete
MDSKELDSKDDLERQAYLLLTSLGFNVISIENAPTPNYTLKGGE